MVDLEYFHFYKHVNLFGCSLQNDNNVQLLAENTKIVIFYKLLFGEGILIVCKI